MTDVLVPKDKIMDPQALGTGPDDIGKTYNRDQTRSPFQWDDSENAGFSTASSTWLPVAANYTLNNVKLQRCQDVSHLNIFKNLISLRQHPTMKYGAFDITALNSEVLIYKRQIKSQKSSDTFVVVLNLGTSKRIIKLKNLFKNALPSKMTVEIASVHSESLVKG